jgi:glycosyltransferase involved in cell wall biosynthesis
MIFIINTTNLQSGGALQVATSLLDEWNSNFIQHQFHIFVSPQLRKVLDQSKFESHIKFYNFDKNPTSNIRSILFFHKELSSLEQKIKPQAVFSIFGPTLWKPKSPHLVGFANGYYLFNESTFIQQHILNSIRGKIYYYSRRFFLFRQLKKESTLYWVETTEAQEKLAATIGELKKNIIVVGNTYGKHLDDKTEITSETNAYTLLYLSAYYPHKNFEIIPTVIDILNSKNVDAQFLVTLNENKYEQLFSNNKTHKKYAHNLGAIKPNETREAYQKADAILMPSLLETFSANYPEAMKMKKPLLCSDFDFARNICGASALYFDPYHATDIADKIIQLINDKKLQHQLIDAGTQQLSKLETPSSRAIKLTNILELMATSKNSVL